MNTFWKLSIFLTVVGSAYSSIQYYRNLTAAKEGVATLIQQLEQQQAYNQERKAEWENITSLSEKREQLAKQSELLKKKKDDLEQQFRRKEGEFKYLAKSIGAAVETVRTASIGEVFPEIRLTDGRVLKNARIRKINDIQVSFIHTDGTGTLAQELLPAALLRKLDLGNDSLVLAIATKEHNLLSSGGQQEYDGLSVRSPFVLKETKNMVKAQSPLLKSHTYEYKSGELEIQFATAWYEEGYALRMDDGVTGAARFLSALEGVSNLRQDVKDTQISGLPAKRLTFTGNRHGAAFYVEALYVMRGQQTWFVLGIVSEKSKDMRPLVNNLLDSVKLQATN